MSIKLIREMVTKHRYSLTEINGFKNGDRVRLNGHEIHAGASGEIYGKDGDLHKIKLDGKDAQPWVHKSQLTKLGEETITELSKDTLRSYASKANAEVQKDILKNKVTNKTWKRFGGATKAVDKLIKKM